MCINMVNTCSIKFKLVLNSSSNNNNHFKNFFSLFLFSFFYKFFGFALNIVSLSLKCSYGVGWQMFVTNWNG
jgi:hypothetical protein